MSKLIETKAEFQQLADERLEEAKALLDLGRWSGAYYLAGYAVELAIKACIIKKLMATDAFPDKEFSKNCYTHDLLKLVKLADLNQALDDTRMADLSLGKNWDLAKDWSELKRYHLITEFEAKMLFNAVAEDVL